jgi:hypothetical protein
MKRIPVVAGLFAVAALALPLSGGESQKFDRSVPFSPSKEHSLNVKVGPVTIESVSISHWPDPDDFRKGEHDLNDKHGCRIAFRYTNRDLDKDWKVHYTVTVTGGGKDYALEQKTETLNKGKVNDDHSFGMRLRTHEYKLAKTLKVEMEVWRKD